MFILLLIQMTMIWNWIVLPIIGLEDHMGAHPDYIMPCKRFRLWKEYAGHKHVLIYMISNAVLQYFSQSEQAVW